MITKAVAGESFVSKFGSHGHRSMAPIGIEVGPPCTAKDAGHWYCLTHDAHLANNWEKSEHISAGSHRLAWSCNHHGIEQP